MKRLALLSIPLFLAPPVFAADLDGPVYSEREIYIERPAPRIVEHRRYYVPAPVEYYYEEAPVYGYAYRYYDRPVYTFNYWRPRHYHPRWHHHHRHGRGW